VQPGQTLEIPAEAFNTFIDAALDFKARQRSQQQSSHPRHPSSTIIKIRNQTGADRERFDVVALESPIIPPADNLQAFKGEPAINGVVPQGGEHFAILLEPVPAGQIARYACVSGVTVARVNVLDEAHQYADIAHDTCQYLESCPSGGAAILWRESGTGVKWAIVRLGNVPDDICRFKLAAPLDRCGQAEAVKIVSSQSSSSGIGQLQWCDTAETITIVDALGIAPVGGLPVDTFGWAKWMAD